MFNAIAAKAATLACTVLLSATCVIGAVGPATAGGQHAVASSARFVA